MWTTAEAHRVADALQVAYDGVWRPHPGPQAFMLSLWDVFELLFGGARSRAPGAPEGGERPMKATGLTSGVRSTSM